jgi:O-methyltransferase
LPDAFTGEHHHRILERRFTLQQLAASVRHLPGATAECGVFKGVTSALICATLRGTYRDGALHYGFDSFEGLPEPGPNDLNWAQGQLATPEDMTRQHLAEFDECRLRVGWMPATFRGLEGERFRLVHIDVDLAEPTRHCLEFFYPRCRPGALILLDDYGFASCPGARSAGRDFMQDKSETVVELTTGQAFFYKH